MIDIIFYMHDNMIKIKHLECDVGSNRLYFSRLIITNISLLTINSTFEALYTYLYSEIKYVVIKMIFFYQLDGTALLKIRY